MSQRKKDYDVAEMITELHKMDSQTIHGSDFFKQVADVLERYATLAKRVTCGACGCIIDRNGCGCNPHDA